MPQSRVECYGEFGAKSRSKLLFGGRLLADAIRTLCYRFDDVADRIADLTDFDGHLRKVVCKKIANHGELVRGAGGVFYLANLNCRCMGMVNGVVQVPIDYFQEVLRNPEDLPVSHVELCERVRKGHNMRWPFVALPTDEQLLAATSWFDLRDVEQILQMLAPFSTAQSLFVSALLLLGAALVFRDGNDFREFFYDGDRLFETPLLTKVFSEEDFNFSVNGGRSILILFYSQVPLFSCALLGESKRISKREVTIKKPTLRARFFGGLSRQEMRELKMSRYETIDCGTPDDENDNKGHESRRAISKYDDNEEPCASGSYAVDAVDLMTTAENFQEYPHRQTDLPSVQVREVKPTNFVVVEQEKEEGGSVASSNSLPLVSVKRTHQLPEVETVRSSSAVSLTKLEDDESVTSPHANEETQDEVSVKVEGPDIEMLILSDNTNNFESKEQIAGKRPGRSLTGESGESGVRRRSQRLRDKLRVNMSEELVEEAETGSNEESGMQEAYESEESNIPEEAYKSDESDNRGAYESPEKYEVRVRKRSRRKITENSEEREVRLARLRAAWAEKVRNETPEQHEKRLARIRVLQSIRTEAESDKQRALRLSRAKASRDKRIRTETPEERVARLSHIKARKAEKRDAETEEQRAARIERERLARVKKRRAETLSQRSARSSRDKATREKKLSMETEEEKLARLERAKLYRRNERAKRKLKQAAIRGEVQEDAASQGDQYESGSSQTSERSYVEEQYTAGGKTTDGEGDVWRDSNVVDARTVKAEVETEPGTSAGELTEKPVKTEPYDDVPTHARKGDDGDDRYAGCTGM